MLRLLLSGARKDKSVGRIRSAIEREPESSRSHWLSGVSKLRPHDLQEHQAHGLEPARLSDDDPNKRMSEESRAGQMQREADVVCVVPSVKEILDSVAAETGLSTFDDDTFRSGLKVSTARIY